MVICVCNTEQTQDMSDHLGYIRNDNDLIDIF